MGGIVHKAARVKLVVKELSTGRTFSIIAQQPDEVRLYTHLIPLIIVPFTCHLF